MVMVPLGFTPNNIELHCVEKNTSLPVAVFVRDYLLTLLPSWTQHKHVAFRAVEMQMRRMHGCFAESGGTELERAMWSVWMPDLDF